MLYPINMELAGRSCVVLGGGPVALRKVCGLLEAEAKVTVISPALRPELAELVDGVHLRWVQRTYRQEDLDGCFLVVCATDREQVNREAALYAKAHGILVNAPAQPPLSDFIVPAIVRRGKLLLSVSTGNISPAFSRLVRKRLEQDFPQAFGTWMERLQDIRQEVKGKLRDARARESFWRTAMDAHIFDLVKAGQLDQAEDELRNAIDSNWVKP